MKKKKLIVAAVSAAAVLSAALVVGLSASPVGEQGLLSPLNRALQRAFTAVNDYTFSVDAADPGRVLPNVRSHINRFGGRFPEDPVINESNNPYAFTEYIQLMECTGGNEDRDLFRDSDDYTVTDDYDFSPLLASCRGILKTGAKPLLKLGNVPRKLSARMLAESGGDDGDFGLNIYPPDDYRAYYDYIKAVAQALVAEFTLEEVRSWRFGVLTEYENGGWFRTPDGDPAASMEAYCSLYDYTVQALLDVLGGDVCVGAHSMTVSEGLWNEDAFIRHCGTGVNNATGKTGTRLCYLASSYYERAPGETGDPATLPEIAAHLRGVAEEAGLPDLLIGVDEGRILVGPRAGISSDDLNSRTVGFTYQAGFDARLIKQMFDSGIDYFSNWEYCSQPENHGNPLISFYVAENAALFKGASLVKTAPAKRGHIPGAEVDVAAAFDETGGTLRVMAYNYKNTLRYLTPADVTLEIHAPQLADGKVTVTTRMIDDDCNWFDEWDAEREALGVTDDKFHWSPDDGCPLWADEEARQIFNGLEDKYAGLCRLTPVTNDAEIKNGRLTVSLTLAPHAVAFLEIKK